MDKMKYVCHFLCMAKERPFSCTYFCMAQTSAGVSILSYGTKVIYEINGEIPSKALVTALVLRDFRVHDMRPRAETLVLSYPVAIDESDSHKEEWLAHSRRITLPIETATDIVELT
jgi:hypothetical protein